MGISREQATKNRAAIVSAAEKLFRERGVDAVGLNDLMDAAGFTRGGFYNHFKSKDDLVAAVMNQAVEGGGERLGELVVEAKAAGKDPLAHQIDWYLSEGHRADIDCGCPLSGFVGDVRRLDAAAQDRYAEGVGAALEHMVAITARPGEDPAEARSRAVALFAEMVGSLLLSRAVAAKAPALSAEILESGRRHLHEAAGPADGAPGAA